MSINTPATVPLIFLPKGSLQTVPGQHDAMVAEPTDTPGVSTPAEDADLFLSASLDDLEQGLEAATSTLALEAARPHLRSRAIHGVLLTGCRGLADLQAADVALGVIEAEAGLVPGTISILAAFGSSPAVFLSRDDIQGKSSRLRALVLDEEALCVAIGIPPAASRCISSVPDAIGVARGSIVLQAAAAGVPCFRLLPDGERDPVEIAHLRDRALEIGFRNVAARDRAQWQALTTRDVAHFVGRTSSNTSPASA